MSYAGTIVFVVEDDPAERDRVNVAARILLVMVGAPRVSRAGRLRCGQGKPGPAILMSSTSRTNAFRRWEP
jgi:hypothetical protein